MRNHRTPSQVPSAGQTVDIVFESEAHGLAEPAITAVEQLTHPQSRTRSVIVPVIVALLLALPIIGIQVMDAVAGSPAEVATEAPVPQANAITYNADPYPEVRPGEPGYRPSASVAVGTFWYDLVVDDAPPPAPLCAYPAGSSVPVSVRSAERWVATCEADIATCRSHPSTADAVERCIDQARTTPT